MTCVPESSESSCAVGPASARPSKLPSVMLRKRKASADSGTSPPPSVDSLLLDGLFADVAEIQEAEAERDGLMAVSPIKKSRCSLTHSISRSPKSFKSLGDALFPSTPSLIPPQSLRNNSPDDLTRQVTPGNSPRTETKCVSHSKALECKGVPSFSSSRSPKSSPLPHTVSSSSLKTLTRVISDLQSSVPETEGKDSYGWFVEVDNEEEKETVNPYHKSSSSNDLAFVATTAPNAVDHDAEVEWAQAADTIDSVLGDFF